MESMALETLDCRKVDLQMRHVARVLLLISALLPLAAARPSKFGPYYSTRHTKNRSKRAVVHPKVQHPRNPAIHNKHAKHRK